MRSAQGLTGHHMHWDQGKLLAPSGVLTLENRRKLAGSVRARCEG